MFLDEADKLFTTTNEPLRSWRKPAFARTPLRDARQTRHTFATTGLMAGIAPGWLATTLRKAMRRLTATTRGRPPGSA